MSALSTTVPTLTTNDATPAVNLNKELSTTLSIILPIIYGLIALIGIVGNLILFQTICANRFRHKSIHLLVLSVLFSDLFFIFIFTIVRAISYGFLNSTWFINPNEWCKAEMYLLHLFDFALAYSIVFMCLDRAVRVGSCWYGVRKFRSGISIVISIWIASAYVLIPILLFKQTIFNQSYGGYLCYSVDQSVPLYWLGTFPRRILDIVDIVFRTLLPAFFMIILLFAASINLCILNAKKSSGSKYEKPSKQLPGNFASQNNYKSKSVTTLNMIDDRLLRRYNNRLFSMVLTYSLVFILCQLPYEIYRCALLCDINLEQYLWKQNLDFSIEIPLLLLKLINRCVNPYLFVCLGDVFGLSKNCCRLWCLPCIPGCIGCKECWCFDCYQTLKFETSYCLGSSRKNKSMGNEDEYVPTGLQTISTYQYKDGERLVTKQKIIEEYETGVEPYYKNPKMRDMYEDQRGANAAMSKTTLGNVNNNFEDDDYYSRFATLKSMRTNNQTSNDRKKIKF
jgi:hypothetical protein